ncbi:MAG: hypothetical protein K0V04_05835, partial [Deltaproteobacteria bacterium]|nr:hypothetical protein [Deltaproteobacteria bacterium]
MQSPLQSTRPGSQADEEPELELSSAVPPDKVDVVDVDAVVVSSRGSLSVVVSGAVDVVDAEVGAGPAVGIMLGSEVDPGGVLVSDVVSASMARGVGGIAQLAAASPSKDEITLVEGR